MDHRKCSASSGIHESENANGTPEHPYGLTYGQDRLDEFGYWSRPCWTCARKAERRDGVPIGSYWPWSRLQLRKPAQEAFACCSFAGGRLRSPYRSRVRPVQRFNWLGAPWESRRVQDCGSKRAALPDIHSCRWWLGGRAIRGSTQLTHRSMRLWSPCLVG